MSGRRAGSRTRRTPARTLARVWTVLAAACCVAALCHPTAFAAPAAPAAAAPGRATTAATPLQVGSGTDAMGIVTANDKDNKLSIGWVGAPGVVVTSDEHADRVGMPATFVRLDGETGVTCYVAQHVDHLRLALLRCGALTGPRLPIASAYPAAGTPSAAVLLPSRRTAMQHLTGNVARNDVLFMGANRLQFSFAGAGQSLRPEDVGGAPVVDGSGQLISTLITAPAEGGQPIGTTPQELRTLVADTAELPESFTTAAFVAIGRRAAIPAAVGLAAGIVWAALTRNNTFIVKALGLAFVGVLGAGAYSVFRLLVEGPQTLLG